MIESKQDKQIDYRSRVIEAMRDFMSDVQGRAGGQEAGESANHAVSQGISEEREELLF